VPARLIKIKYITIRAEKVASPVTALQSKTTKPNNTEQTKMWANAQRDGRPAKHGWRPLFNAAKFG